MAKEIKAKILTVKSMPYIPQYFGSSKKDALTITKNEIVKAINKGRRHTPGEWQAEILEIALIPKVWAHLTRLYPGPYDSLTRVKGGYTLKTWNSPDRPYPGIAFDGLRRNFDTIGLQGLRSLVVGEEESLNLPVIEEWLENSEIRFHNIGGRKPRKPKPLPPEAIYPQTLRLNSTEATCYGKETKRGYRVYCRIKKE